MPVLVTAADTPPADRLVARLLHEGGEVRAYCTGAGEGDPGALRAAGAFVAVGDLDDEGRLEAAMTDVHTVVHLGVDPLARSVETVRRDAATVVRAAGNAGIRRLVVRSVPGAGGADPLRQVAGEVESWLAAVDVPSIVVRAGLVDRPALRDALGSARLDTEARGVTVAPVRADDLVEVIVALDAMRSTAASGHVVFAADGPRRMTMGAYLDAVLDGGLVGHVWRPPGSVPLLRPALAGPWCDDEGWPDVWSLTAVTPGPVS